MSCNDQQNEAGLVQGNQDRNEMENVQILPEIPDVLDGGNMTNNFPSILLSYNDWQLLIADEISYSF